MITPKLWLRGAGSRWGETAHPATLRALFVTPTHRTGRLTHIPAETYLVWRSGLPVRLAAFTRCGRQLDSVRPVAEAPGGRDYCDWCLLADSIPAQMYRLLGAGDVPLYIGATTNLVWRLRGHMSGSHFWPLVVRWTTTPFVSIEEALVAERAAILAEDPIFNLDYTARAKRRSRRPAAMPCIPRRPVRTGAPV